MKVIVGKTLFGTGYTVRLLDIGGLIFRTGFQGSETEAQNLATSIRKALNRSGTKKKSLTATAGL